MRRSTPGVFSGVEPHTPRVCGSKSNSSFRANSDDSRRCIPPPVPCRNQPPPLPPKHHFRKNTGVEFNKHREPLEPLDSYGKYVYESISDSNVSSRSNRHLPLPRSYATRNFPQSSTTSPFGFRSVSPHTIGFNCGGRNVSGHAPYDARTFKYPFSTPFAFDPNSELLKGPCTCSLGAGGGKKLSFNSSNQSPVWSKMPLVVTRPSDAVQSKATRSGARDQNHQEKKSTHVDNRPWTISRLSRTMSRFFRRGMSHRKSKSNSMRSRSDYFNDFQDKFNGNIAPVPSHLSAVRSPAVTLPSSPSVPLPPTVPPLTEETATSTSSALHCHDAVRHQHPVQTVAMVSTSTEMPTCTSPPSISCVHHVHHIHHVHHVHHHLHHLPPPPPPPPASLPSPGSQAVTSFPPPVTDDAAAALIMMLENAATLGETPPLPTLPLSVLKDSKSAEQQVSSAGNSHTYSAYGVRSGATPACCPISPTPPPPQPPPPPLPPQPSSASTLHRQNTTVCSDPRCITAHCRRHVQGSPGDHQHRTPTSIELAELAEAGAEAVFANGGNGGRTTTMTTTSSSSCTDPLPPSPPNATSVVPSCPNSPAPPTPAATAGAGATPAPTHLMHHMHHHHMHHMLHHLRPPSTTSATANAAAIAPVHPAPAAAPVSSSSAVSNSTTTPDHRSSFQESMKALRKMGWYWGPLSFTEAEKLLANRPDGTFLVRDSAHDTFFLSLSFRVRGTTYHTRIEHNQGRFSFWFEPESHSASTVVEFIEKAVAHSIGGKYHYFLQTSTPGQQPVEVSLLYPLSRFQVVQSLKHLARFTILSHVRRDHVARLPLPPGQIGYLLEKQVYWESLEDFEETIRDRPPLQFTPVAASSSSSTAKP